MDVDRGTLAVIGGGWAGLAAAVRATEAGYRVTLFEMPAIGAGAHAVWTWTGWRWTTASTS